MTRYCIWDTGCECEVTDTRRYEVREARCKKGDTECEVRDVRYKVRGTVLKTGLRSCCDGVALN
jgi:hypothetical protein